MNQDHSGMGIECKVNIYLICIYIILYLFLSYMQFVNCTCSSESRSRSVVTVRERIIRHRAPRDDPYCQSDVSASSFAREARRLYYSGVAQLVQLCQAIPVPQNLASTKIINPEQGPPDVVQGWFLLQ